VSSQISDGINRVLSLSPIPIVPNTFNVLDGILATQTATSGLANIEGVPVSLISAQSNLTYLAGAAAPAPALGPMGLSEFRGAASAPGLGGPPNAITVSMGRANTIGPMSVPASWSAPSTSRIAALEPAGLTTLPGTDELAGSGYPGVPGMPAGTVARASGVLPRYGTRLTVMTRPLAGG
jgi:PPE-SVP subfamily C-terminal region